MSKVDTESAVDREYNKVLAEKLAIIEELRHSLHQESIDCPGVVVVGNQSAGKSSVLESLTGIAFPRDQNTCTRVPTIVQLQRSSNGTSEFEVSTEADFKDSVMLSDPTATGDELKKAQVKLIERSGGQAVADDPIHVRFKRAVGPVMTLIDLPGITHFDKDGLDIHKATTSMVQTYIEQQNMIVLVVIPANEDFGNTEALEMIRKKNKNWIERNTWKRQRKHP